MESCNALLLVMSSSKLVKQTLIISESFLAAKMTKVILTHFGFPFCFRFIQRSVSAQLRNIQERVKSLTSCRHARDVNSNFASEPIYPLFLQYCS